MPIGATLGAAAIGAGSSIFGAQSAANSSKKANAQNQANLKPYMDAGQSAIGQLNDPNALMKGFYASPNYNFTMQQGLNAVGTDKAVNGLLRSGSALKSLNTFAQNTAANQWNSYVSQKQFIADKGLTAADPSINSNNSNAATQGNAAIATGNAVGGFAGALAPIITSYASNPQQYSQSSYKSAGGGG